MAVFMAVEIRPLGWWKIWRYLWTPSPCAVAVVDEREFRYLCRDADSIYGRRSADSMVAIGDGNEEEAAARVTGMQFVRIDDRVESLRGLSSL